MKFLLAIGLLLTAFSFFLVFRTWRTGYAYLQQNLENQTALAADFDQAVREVFQQSQQESLTTQADPSAYAASLADAVFEQVASRYPHDLIRITDAELDAFLQTTNRRAAGIRQLFAETPSMKSTGMRLRVSGRDYYARFMVCPDPADGRANGQAAVQMIAVPLSGFASQIDEQTYQRLPGLMFGLLGLLAAVYASFQLIAGRHLRRFAGHLKKTAEQTDEFQFEPLAIKSNDEVGLIADRYNELGATLEKMYHTLEVEVRKRTFELRKTNEDLQRKMNECRCAEEQATVLAHEAMAANRAKSEFLANMSHELRTPMNSIVGFSEVLADTPLQEDQRNFVKMISTNSLSLLELINDLLDFSRIEAGEMEIESDQFEIGDLLEDIESMMRPLATQKDIRFDILPCDFTKSTLNTDRIRLRQCLINLISNAIKFTDSGHVSVSLTLEQGDLGDALLRFDVEDTGIGIAADKLELIFDSFTQADGAMNRKYGGTGLGLAITKRLSELIGGRLSVRSEEGRGSTFSIWVPADQICRDEDAAVLSKYKQIEELDEELI